MTIWKREDELGLRLRAIRPKPRPEFVRALEVRIEQARRPRGMRVALAGAMTAAALAVFGAFGALSYAAHSVEAATHGLGASSSGGNGAGSATAAQDQYVGKTTICHRTGSAKNPFVLITVSNNALPAHKAHGDTLAGPGGTCPGPPIP
jgi:hypothetical protein